MTQLKDMISISVKNSSGDASVMEAEWYVQFAFQLHIGLQEAYKLFEQYGCGHIYALTGMVMEDSEHLRGVMARTLGKVVVVEADGTTWVNSAYAEGRNKRAEAIKRWKRARTEERKQVRAEREERRSARERERVFNGGMGHPNRKRQGKADSLSDIGKYAWNPARRVTDSVPMVGYDSRKVYHHI